MLMEVCDLDLTKYFRKEHKDDAKTKEITDAIHCLEVGEVKKQIFQFDDPALQMLLHKKPSGYLFELMPNCRYEINVIPHLVGYDRFEHFHNYFEMIYVYKGTCHTKVDGTTLTLNEGDVCFLNLQALHSMESTNPKTDMFFNLLISQSTFDNTYFKLISGNELVSDFFLDSIQARRKQDNYILFTKDSTSSPFENLIQHIIYEYYECPLYKEKMLEALLTAFLIELAGNYKQRINIEGSKEFGTRDISEIIQYIIDNCQNVNISELAEHFHYQAPYLSTLIKKYSGSSFSDILHEIRLKKASLMLLETDLTVTEIMETIGCSNRTWFTKRFNARYKSSPSEYRKNLKKQADN